MTGNGALKGSSTISVVLEEEDEGKEEEGKEEEGQAQQQQEEEEQEEGSIRAMPLLL